MNTRPVIIGGFYRSGTTLLRRLIDAHSRFHCPPEIKFFKDFFGDYLDDPLAHVRCFRTLRSLDVPEDELLARFGAVFIECREIAARRAGKARWADKNPENVLYLPQWQSLLSEGFFFIHVVRDPLDALASLREIGFSKTVPAAFEAKVRLYKQYREAGESWCRKHPATSMTIHYEVLVRQPEETLRKLFAALGEVFEPEVLDLFHAPTRGVGIEDPKVATTRAVHADSVGRWKRDLSAEEVHTGRWLLGSVLDSSKEV